jgi:hypothetical protein
MTMPLEPTSARLSGVDPFRAPESGADEESLETVWFDQPASSRRISLRPTQPPPSSAPPAPIGEADADTWFK